MNDLALHIRKASRWPRAPFDVYGTASARLGPERFAGGFWTRRGAQKWIDEFNAC